MRKKKIKASVFLTLNEHRLLKETAKKKGRTIAQELRELIRANTGADAF